MRKTIKEKSGSVELHYHCKFDSRFKLFQNLFCKLQHKEKLDFLKII